MRIENITEYLKTQDASAQTSKIQGGDTDTEVSASCFLREINIDSPFYDKDTIADQLEGQLSDGQASSEEQTKTKLTIASAVLSEGDLSEMEKQGFQAEDLDPEDFVNIGEKIKLSLAKGGMDVSIMGGLDSDTVAKITGSTNYAVTMTEALSEVDLPTDPTMIQDGAVALQMVEEIEAKTQNGLSEDAMKYLLKTNATPTIENIYQAVYSTTSAPTSELSASIPEEIESSVKKVIESLGLTVDEDALNSAAWMLNNDIPITPENVLYLSELQSFTCQSEDALQSIVTAVNEGQNPKEAYLVPGYSLLDQASAAVDALQVLSDEDVDKVTSLGEKLTIQNLMAVHLDTSDTSNSNIAGYKQLETIRLQMTLEASYTMMRNGIDVNTTELQNLIEELSAMEEDSTAIPSEVENTISSLEEMPAVLLGRIPDIKSMSLRAIYQEGEAFVSSSDGRSYLAQAAGRYETMMTEVRSDLGDRIATAFDNSVDEILSELKLDSTPSNERAVRILGYNEMEITTDSISSMKEVDELVQRTFKSLTPATVLEMVRNDVNPLDMTVEEVIDSAEEIQGTIDGTASEERFSKFLYKLDETGAITEEERDSILGIYRLMHQVNATDGAAIGTLLKQGSEVTMRNLLTAVRTRKHENQEYVVSDETGLFAGFEKSSLSITDQIEMAFQANRMLDAEEAASPYKLQEIGTSECMQMTPDQIASALEEIDEPDEYEKEYQRQVRSELQQAYQAEEEVYSGLSAYSIPATAMNLQAMTSLYNNRNVWKSILDRPHTNLDGSVVDLSDIDLDALMEMALEDYGEAIKTPEEMAEAQQKLAETAENVLKQDMTQDVTARIDLRSLQLQNAQISIFTQMSKSETYNIPILVADENGTMTLKIVRGQEENGLVDIAYSNDRIGSLRAALQYVNGEMVGSLETDSSATREVLSENATILAGRIQEETGLSVSLSIGFREDVSLNDIYTKDDYGFETSEEGDQIQTRTLYSIARAFVQGLSELA